MLVQSVFEDAREWREVGWMEGSRAGTLLWCRARLATVRAKGKFAFVVLRKGFSSVQAVVAEGEAGWTREGVKWVSRIPVESVVDLYGELVKAEQPTHTSQSEVELRTHRLFVVSLASPHLPFQLSDAARPPPETIAAPAEPSTAQHSANSSSSSSSSLSSAGAGAGSEEKSEGGGEVIAPVEAGGGVGVVDVNGVITVGQDIRLDNRWLDLRTPANHAIFRLQSRVCQFYRQFFLDRDFVEIHTPKLTPGVSPKEEPPCSSSNTSTRDACLAQSPQLYKQMCIASDLSRVFEIGPVFRAEYSNVTNTRTTRSRHIQHCNTQPQPQPKPRVQSSPAVSTPPHPLLSSPPAHSCAPLWLWCVCVAVCRAQTHRHMCEFTGYGL